MSFFDRVKNGKNLPHLSLRTECAIFGALSGAIVFLLIYGFLPLDVTNDQWILNGYVEPDATNHYAGWVNFRNSEWKWPLGYTDNLAYPTGVMISFTDSIPWVAILFKLVRSILPDTFQYFGIYVLACFILQGISASFLLTEFTKNRPAIMISTIIFLISPIMIERAFRHTALASHFLIIFSLYLYFHSKHNVYKKEWGYAVLFALAIGIHPYFLPMIFGIFCANVLEMLLNKNNWKHVAAYMALTFIPCIICGISIGAIGSGVTGDGGSFGYYSMNINALFNPTSINGINWSNVIKVQPQILGNYDGFNYLGLGILIGLFLLLFGCIIGKIKVKKDFFVRNIGLCIAVVVFYLFAISNVVTFNEHQIASINLPEPVERLFSIFRASSRMFYPVFYVILLTVVLAAIKYISKERITVTLCILVGIQTFDIWPALSEKADAFDKKTVQQIYSEKYDEAAEYWRIIAENYSEVRFLNYFSDRLTKASIAAFVGKAELNHANIIIGARGVYDTNEAQKAINELITNQGKDNVLYATTDVLIADFLGSQINKDYTIYKVGACFCIAKKNDALTEIEYEPTPQISLCELSDVNWEKGINRYDKTIWLFTYNPMVEMALSRSTYIRSSSFEYHIESYERRGDYIHVKVDSLADAEDVAYPAQLTFSFDK